VVNGCDGGGEIAGCAFGGEQATRDRPNAGLVERHGDVPNVHVSAGQYRDVPGLDIVSKPRSDGLNYTVALRSIAVGAGQGYGAA
jgi:hypothetical protein